MCLTWNVNARPCSEQLDGLVQGHGEPVDVCAIGLQECKRVHEWITRFSATLNTPYALVGVMHRNSTAILLFVREAVAARVTEVEEGFADFTRKCDVSKRVVSCCCLELNSGNKQKKIIEFLCNPHFCSLR